MGWKHGKGSAKPVPDRGWGMAGTQRTVIVALVANLAIAGAKFVGAWLSGSAGLVAEALHSLVDTGNEGFLYLGLALQRRPGSPSHPLGYGRERFFWSFVAAIFIFAGGSLFALQHGWARWQEPAPITDFQWAFAILAFAFLAEGISLAIALRQAKKGARKRRLDLLRHMRTTPDSTLLTVVLEDGGALVGLAFAAMGLTMTLLTGDPRWDAAASMAIGCMLGVLAFILGGRAHSLLIGQAADTRTLDKIDRILQDAPFVARVVDSYTTQLSPENLILAAHIQVNVDLSADTAGALIACLEEQLIAQIPALQHIFIEIEPSVTSAGGCRPRQDGIPASDE